jgi:hypothetical protein
MNMVEICLSLTFVLTNVGWVCPFQHANWILNFYIVCEREFSKITQMGIW